MPYCSKCGAKLDQDAKFCPKCGTVASPPVPKSERKEILGKQKRRMSTLTVILVVLLAVVVIVAAAVALALVLGVWQPFGQVIGSEDLVTQDRFFSDFSAVEVRSGFEVEITQSSIYSIKITADDNVLDYIEVSKTSDKLTIRLKWGYIYRNVTLRAKITMPELNELKLSSGTSCKLKEFSTSNEFIVELSGGSHLSGEFTTSQNVRFTLAEGAYLSIDGAANSLDIRASLGSHLELSDFMVHDATVNLSNGSSATINLDGRLDGDLSGGSNLKYLGNPTTIDVNTSGGSTVGPQ